MYAATLSSDLAAMGLSTCRKAVEEFAKERAIDDCIGCRRTLRCTSDSKSYGCRRTNSDSEDEGQYQEVRERVVFHSSAFFLLDFLGGSNVHS